MSDKAKFNLFVVLICIYVNLSSFIEELNKNLILKNGLNHIPICWH